MQLCDYQALTKIPKFEKMNMNSCLASVSLRPRCIFVLKFKKDFFIAVIT